MLKGVIKNTGCYLQVVAPAELVDALRNVAKGPAAVVAATVALPRLMSAALCVLVKDASGFSSSQKEGVTKDDCESMN